ncbi:hypothetical protein SK128_020386, partial [Halocaridina rubra]
MPKRSQFSSLIDQADILQRGFYASPSHFSLYPFLTHRVHFSNIPFSFHDDFPRDTREQKRTPIQCL